MEISVIILNWHAAHDTIACVNVFSDWHTITPHIFVVDNGSTKMDSEQITAVCPHVHLLKNKTNLGFAGGNNTGIRAALEKYPTTPILLLNNDATLAESAALALLEALHTNVTAGCVGPLLMDSLQPEKILAAGGNNPVQHLRSHRQPSTAFKQPFDVDYVPGTAILIRADVFRRIGLLDERYFFSMEIADFCHRARQAGFQSIIVPTATASHSIQRSGARRKSLYPYYTIRNRFLFLRKHYARYATLWMFWIAYSFALMVKTALAGERALSRAVWLGLADGVRGRFGNQNAHFLGGK